MKAIATYRRLSKEDRANPESWERQGWELDMEAAKYPDRQRLHFEDKLSGRRSDRPGFLSLIRAIESDRIDLVIVSRIDRLGRDLEDLARFQKLLQRKKVKVYEVLLGGFLDWDNPNSWSYFSNAGLDGEKESRMLARRIKQTFDYQRAQGKFGGGRVGFPYRRSKEGKIEPDPNNWGLAIECVKIICDRGGATMEALAGIRALGLNRTRTWLSHWIRSPLLRGHTPQDTRQVDGNRKPRSEFTILFDTHPSLFADPRLKGYQKQLDWIIADSTKIKGATRSRPIYPLSGLIYCDRCGKTCHIRTISDSKYPQKKYIYAMCANRATRGLDCGGEYGVFRGQRRTINTVYSEIEDAVILALTQKATELVDLAIAQEPSDKPEHPDIAKLKGEIDRLLLFNDPDLEGAIAKKTLQLNKLQSIDSPKNLSADLRLEFIDLFSDPTIFFRLSDTEKRDLYRSWVDRVNVDRENIKVVLLLED